MECAELGFYWVVMAVRDERREKKGDKEKPNRMCDFTDLVSEREVFERESESSLVTITNTKLSPQ